MSGRLGVFPGSSIGWVTLGLGGGTFALSLAAGKLKDHKYHLVIGGLQAVTLIVIGALGCGGILSTSQVGWGIIGASIGAALAASPATIKRCADEAAEKEKAYRQLADSSDDLARILSNN